MPHRLPIVAYGFAAATLLTAAPATANSGDSADALPGLVRLPVVNTVARGLAVAASAGYGYTGSVVGDGDAYSRASGTLAMSYQPASFFAAALRLDGRYDVDTGRQSASGATGDPRLELRFMLPEETPLRLGAQVGVWAPGGSAPSLEWRAITPDFSALAGYASHDQRLIVTSRVGFRWENSAESVANPSQLTRFDRVELGLNQANAVLTGVGVEYRALPTLELLFDATWDLLVGSGAPPAGDDPILLSAGARGAIDADQTLQIEGAVIVSPSGRPTVSASSPLVDIEPRVSLVVGLVVRPWAKRPTPHAEARVEAPVRPALPAAPLRVKLRGRATAEDGVTPLTHAHVVITPKGGEKQEFEADQDGRFESGDLEPGEVCVVVMAPGFDVIDRRVTLTRDPVSLDIAASHALPAGEVRGVVRDLTGKPVNARVRIEPAGIDVAVRSDGTFRSEVQPGAYDVIVRASGYAEQKRHITVERDAVFVLNVELRRPPR